MRKVLSLALALVLAIGMTTVAFAKLDAISTYSASEVGKSTNDLIDLMFWDGTDWVDELVANSKAYNPNSDPGNDSNGYVHSMHAGMEVSQGSVPMVGGLYLLVREGTTKEITNGGGTPTDTGYAVGAYKYGYVTKSNVNKWDVSVSLSSGSATWKKIGLAYDADGNAYVRFVLADYHVATNKKQSTDTITLKADGNTIRSAKAELKTAMENAKETIDDKDDDEISLYGDKRVIEAKVSIPKFWVELDYDAVLTTRLFDGRNMYLHLAEPATDLTMAICDKYGFAFNRQLKQVGLSADASTINFDEPGTWVYAIDNSKSYDPVADSVQLIYLGKGDANLPIYEDYFFSLKEITLAVETPVEPPVESSATSAPVANNPNAGPADAVPNVNYNPGTGC